MSRIVIIGMGPGSPGQLTAEAWQALTEGRPLYLRTGKHPLARRLAHGGLKFRTFDSIYSQAKDFPDVYRTIARRLLRRALCCGTVYYAVPGDPMVGEAAVNMLLRVAPRHKIKIDLIPGMSFLEPALAALRLDLLEGVTVMDALVMDKLEEPHRRHLLLAQIYCRSVASRVKLKLLQLYPPDYMLTILYKAGLTAEKLIKTPLYALDRHCYDHHTLVYLPPYSGYTVSDLLSVVSRLRADGGCPWDKRQTHRSLRQYLVEETYEVIAAIDQGNDASLAEELGDLLLQVVFHSSIAEEGGRFSFSDVINGICKKLIRRHPHVFGNERAQNVSQVKVFWEQIKSEEKGCLPGLYLPDSGLPALLGAYKVQLKAAEMGFDWPSIDGAWEKLNEETIELEDAYQQGFSDKIEEEFGDLLFAAVNLARFMKVNPELALGKALRKFGSRFRYILKQVEKDGKQVSDYTLEELDRFWEKAKNKGNC
jgi:tetrapyrrole methylase family protein/MazG family protein